MGRVRSKNTKPEVFVRSLLHRNGFRFRLHKKELPGKPDIVLSKYRTVVFVHGCFWHRHKNCSDATTPKTRTNFWLKKFEGNVERDKKAQRALHLEDWRVVVVWECEMSKPDRLLGKIWKEIRK